MRKLLLLLCSLIVFIGQAVSQVRTIRGKVVDIKGNPVAGATIQVKGSGKGTPTSNDGIFSIGLSSADKKLLISAVNFTSVEADIADNLVITLQQSVASLDEVVVTAYGNTLKNSFTGTASTVNSDRFKDQQVSSISNVLQGQASGIQVVNANGQPGENPDIRIRGIGSVNASADPFILLDGAPYGGYISSINPADIESITVLKDASSTALYGSRAANGILQITTRSGKGTPKVFVSGVKGYSKRAVDDYKYINNTQLYELTWEALRNQANITPGILTVTGAASPEDYASQSVAGTLVYNPFGVANPVGLDGKIVAGAKNLWNDSWSDILTRTADRTDINMSISGGSDKTKYFISGGYLDDAGIPVESRFKRYSGRLKLDTKVNDWLNVGLNTSLSYSAQNYPEQGGSDYANVIGWIRNTSAIYPEYLRDPSTGSFILDGNGNKQFDYGNNGPLKRPIGKGSNPAGTATLNPTVYDRTINSFSGFAEARIITGLKYRSQYSIDLFQTAYSQFLNPFVGDGSAYGGSSEKKQTTSNTQTFTNTLTYERQFAHIHHINLVAGMEAYRFHQGVVDAMAKGFTFPGATELQYGSTPTVATSYSYDNRMVSYFGRLNYDLTDKYHLSVSLRRDGSSRFADSVRWGTFWSVGGAWNINREDFAKGIAVLSDLKLRASYGTTGNQIFLDQSNSPIYFPYLATYSAGANIAGYSGSNIANVANGKLTWESQKDLDLGIDFGLLKNRITGSFTYFSRKSDRLFFARPLPPSSGNDFVNDNIGAVTNKGFEIELTTVNIKKKKFSWTTNLNVSRIRNRITELPQQSVAGPNFSNLAVGQPLNNFYIREYAGVDQTDGTPMWYVDQTDGTGKTVKTITKQYSKGTRYFEGSSLPDWTGGINNTLTYGNFDFSILAYISFRGKIYDADYASLMHSSVGTDPGRNWTTDIFNRWQDPVNRGDGKTPRLTTTSDDQANSTSTRFLFDNTYMRIRNITLGYHLPGAALSRTRLSSLRVYIALQNPLTFYKQKGLDPEGGGLAGVTSNTSSVYKTYSAGINMEF